MDAKHIVALYRIVASLVLVSLLAFGEIGHASAGSIRYVKAGATGLHNGTSWTNAFTSLQQALNVAASGDQIWVAKGTYKPTLRTNSGDSRSVTFAMKNGVAIYGSFAGTETAFSQRRLSVSVTTILSGDIGFVGNATDNAYHVVLASAAVFNSSILDGFTITLGNANGFSSPDSTGGGLNNSGSPTLRNLIFSSNTTVANGGAIYNNLGSPALSNVVFDANSAIGDDAIGSGLGAALFNESGHPTLTNVTFRNNWVDCPCVLFIARGGAIYSADGSLTLTNVTFTGNAAKNNGDAAVIYNWTSDSMFPSLLNLTNVTIANNVPAFGGALWNVGGGQATLKHVTFTGSSGLGSSNIVNAFSSTMNISNSIFWGSGVGFSNQDTSLLNIIDSVVQGGCPSGTSCTHLITTDPKLGPLQSNLGFTQTMALGAGSPAIDSGGMNSTCTSKDQRGFARPQGTGCDIGAYEVRILSFASQAANDGWVLETSKGSNTGGTPNSTGTTLLVGDDASNRRYRSILSFATALPKNSTVVLARLMLLKQTIIGNPTATGGNLVADLANPYFGGQLSLQNVDWQWTASDLSTPTNPSFKPPFAASGGGWYTGTLNPAWLGQINKVSTTQFRLRLPKENNNGTADYFSFYSGNTTTVANRPILWVYYNP